MISPFLQVHDTKSIFQTVTSLHLNFVTEYFSDVARTFRHIKQIVVNYFIKNEQVNEKIT